MKRPHDSPFNNAPESFDGVRMHSTVDALTGRAANGAMLCEFPHVVVTVIFVGADQGNFVA